MRGTRLEADLFDLARHFRISYGSSDSLSHASFHCHSRTNVVPIRRRIAESLQMNRNLLQRATKWDYRRNLRNFGGKTSVIFEETSPERHVYGGELLLSRRSTQDNLPLKHSYAITLNGEDFTFRFGERCEFIDVDYLLRRRSPFQTLALSNVAFVTGVNSTDEECRAAVAIPPSQRQALVTHS